MKYSILLILLCVFSHTMAKEQIIVMDLQGWTTPDNLSKGNILLNGFVEYSSLDIELVHLPNARAIKSIAQSKFHCVFSGAIDTFESYTNRKAIGVENIQTIYWHYITSEKQPLISNEAQLKNKNLAVINGLKLDKFSLGVDPSHFNYIDQVTKFEIIRKMLTSNRVDAGYISLELNEEIEGFHYDPNFYFLEISRGLNCAADYPNSQIIIEEFNQYLHSINYW